jgi:hypothetical protein
LLTHASCAQLVAVVRETLATTVTPHVTDDVARVALGMADSVLQHVMNRVDDENRWMAEEIADVRALADDLREALPDRDVALEDGIAAMEETAAASDATAVRDRYNAATRLLCTCVQVSTHLAEAFEPRIQQTLQTRLTRELEIRGEFVFAR